MENLKNKATSINGRERVKSSNKQTDKFSSIPKVTGHHKGRKGKATKEKTIGDRKLHY